MNIRNECSSRIDTYIANQRDKGTERLERVNELITEYSSHYLHKMLLVPRFKDMCHKNNYDDWGESEREILLALCAGLNEYHCAWIWKKQPEQRANLYRLLRAYREILEYADDKDEQRITLIAQLEAHYKVAYFSASNDRKRLERILVKGQSEEMVAAAAVLSPDIIEKYEDILIDGMHHWEPDRAYCAALCLVKTDNNSASEYVSELLSRICSLYIQTSRASMEYFFRLLRYTSMIGIGNEDLDNMMVGLISYFPLNGNQQPRHEEIKVLTQYIVQYFKKRGEKGLVSLSKNSTMSAINVLFMIGTTKALEYLSKAQPPMPGDNLELFKVFRWWMIEKPLPDEESVADEDCDLLDNPFIE